MSKPVPIHDHFDGTEHCVNCAGPCTLTGAERVLSATVRWYFEDLARYNLGSPNLMMYDLLQANGVDPAAFRQRAERTVIGSIASKTVNL